MSTPVAAPTVLGRSTETMLEFDPHDPIDAVELDTWDRQHKRARFRLALLTIKATDGAVWHVHAAGPRVDEHGLVAGGDVGYLRDEWHEVSEHMPSAVAELVRAEVAR